MKAMQEKMELDMQRLAMKSKQPLTSTWPACRGSGQVIAVFCCCCPTHQDKLRRMPILPDLG